jgi:outer membrane protein assembly factor BamB
VTWSRRTFLGACAAGIVTAGRSDASQPHWTVLGDFDAWAVVGDEIIAVGSRLAVLDAATGQERRSVRLSPPSAPERVRTVTATPTTIVFGWYGWRGDGRIVCVDTSSLRIRWQRRIAWPDNEREHSPGVFAVIRDNALFVLLSGKRGENLFRLRPDTGETVWSQTVERFVLGVPLIWHDGRLLVQSRVTQHYPHGHGHYQAIDPTTGASVWRVRFEGTAGLWDDTPLIVGQTAYLTCEAIPAPSSRLYVVDLAAGRVVLDRMTVDALREPFAERDGVVYFATQTPAAWDAARDRVVWRTRLVRAYSTGPSIVEGVFDRVRGRIYLGDSTDSLYKLSASDGATLERFDIRGSYVNPARGINSGYGVRRMQLINDRLVIGTEDGRLLSLPATP